MKNPSPKKITYFTDPVKQEKHILYLIRYLNKNSKVWFKKYDELTGISISLKKKKTHTYKSYAIVFHVEKKDLKPLNPLPKQLIVKFPNKKNKFIRTDIVETAPFSFRQDSSVIEIGEGALDRVSGDKGTISFFLKSESSEDIYLCSNMHVLGSTRDNNFFTPKSQQFQPDIFLKDSTSDVTLNAFLERGISDTLDIAFARIQSSQLGLIKTVIAGIGIPTSSRQLRLIDRNLELRTRGNKTQQEKIGKLLEVGKQVRIGNKIFQNLQVARLFSTGGDSGAPVYDGDLQIVGIIIGGPNNDLNTSYIIPIEKIENFIKTDSKIKQLKLSIIFNQFNP
jgi:hypothetical protein